MEIRDYQERVPAQEVRVGDFIDAIEPSKMRGPRGGRYRFDGMKIESRVLEVLHRGDCGRGRPYREFVVGFRTSRGIIQFQSNVLHFATAIIRKREEGR